jgi:hypothetical protein
MLYLLHEYIEDTLPVMTIGGANRKKGEVRRTASHTSPIQLNVAYSFGWSKQKRKHVFSKMAAKFKYKRKSITTLRKHYPALTTFHNPLHSHLVPAF